MTATPASVARTPDSEARAVLAAAASAWLLVMALAASPWAVDFSHDALEHIGGHVWAVGTLAVGWILMVVAMMLPTTLPLISMFDRITDGRADRGALRAGLIGAYLLVWSAAGVAMHLGDFGIHRLVDHWRLLARNTWVIETSTLALAGAYQLTPGKDRCLRRCRTPQSLIRAHWRGGSPLRQALRIGGYHGVYCLGCCWALMLVMFSVGTGNIMVMGGLTAVMVAEKTQARGTRITVPVGLLLLCAALATGLTRPGAG